MEFPSGSGQRGSAESAAGFGIVEVSYVLPCLNESATIGNCISQACQAIYELGLPGEIIVADNGSTDNSREIACNMGAKVIDVPIHGYGAAIIFGCRAAAGQYIVIADSDASYNLVESIAMVRQLQSGADLVMGTRLKGDIQPGAMPWKNRYIGNPILTGILNFLFHSGLSDAHSGMRAFTRSAFDQMDLRCAGMEFASEMVVKASLLDLRRGEIPISYLPDGRNHKSHLRPWRDGWRHLRFLLLYSPRWVFLVPGLVLFWVGLLLNTILVLTPEPAIFSLGRVFFGTHWTIPSTLAAALGLQAIYLGIITLKYSIQNGLYPPPNWFNRISRGFSLELILALGLLFSLVGLYLEMTIFIHWIKSGFGALAEIRKAMYGFMWILLGAESIFNSFVLGLLTQVVETLPDSTESMVGGSDMQVRNLF
jgi:glycosyltransferase involved in cell wall biosynthesis